MTQAVPLALATLTVEGLNPHRQLRRLEAARIRRARQQAELIEAFCPQRPPVVPREPCVLATDVKIAIRESDGYCRYCITGPAATVDHIVPWSRGGTNDPSNLVGSCRPCNEVKGNLTPREAGMTMDVPLRVRAAINESVLFVAP